MSYEINEECGVVGVFGEELAAQLCFFGLYALQHRGQESAGIATMEKPDKINFYKDFGLVKDVFRDPKIIESLKGSIAIGHNRYSTTGKSEDSVNIQPIVVDYKRGPIAIAHNGNLVNAMQLRGEMEKEGHIFQSSSDSEVIVHLIARSKKETIEEMVIDALKQVKGSFSIVIAAESKLIAVRDPKGIRPLAFGKRESSFIVASETCAFDIVSASYIRDIEPGELLSISGDGVQSFKYANEKPSHCIFEYIYFSRPDSIIFEKFCDKIRRYLGKKLAEEHPVDADIVISVPDSSNTIALGYAKESKIPFEIGILRNHYVGRTFIQPTQALRDLKVKIKFNPIKGVLRGKRVIVVDDSIVRGTTLKNLVSLLRDAGAKELHLRIGSPPVISPCFYGMDFPSKQELIANSMQIEEIRSFLGVDTLGYLSLEGLHSVVGNETGCFCDACFSGSYPIVGEMSS